MRAIQKETMEAASAAQVRDANRYMKTAKTWVNYSPFVKAKFSILLKQRDEAMFPEA
jgi:hypothetical protein